MEIIQTNEIKPKVILVSADTGEFDAERSMKELEELLAVSNTAQVLVREKVYPGTKIIISDVSKIVKNEAQYCRFIKSQGDVVMSGM